MGQPPEQRVLAVQRKAAPTSALVEAACYDVMKSLLLLALVVGLRRMLVSGLGFIGGLRRLLLRTHVIVAAVLLRGGPMSLRCLLMMFGSLLVHILRHNYVLAVFEAVERNVPCRIDAAKGGGAETSVRRRFFGSLHGKPQACVYLVKWRAEPEPQWRAENKPRGRLQPADPPAT